jgi:hypothetical protein
MAETRSEGDHFPRLHENPAVLKGGVEPDIPSSMDEEI